MSDAPQVWLDLEFHFTHGEPLFATLMEGRDTLEAPNTPDQPWRVTIQATPDETETLLILPGTLNGLRTTRRTVPPPA